MWNLFTAQQTTTDGSLLQAATGLPPASKRIRLDNGYAAVAAGGGGCNNNHNVQFSSGGFPAFGFASMDATAMMGMMGHTTTAQQVMANADALKEAARLETRRKKNAILAKKSRDRKKNLEVSLSNEMRELQEENERLKGIVKSQCDDDVAQDIIGECCYKPRGEGFRGAQSSKLSRSDFDLIESLTASRQSFVLTDPNLPDNPIVYASCSFLKITGYTREKVIGRNCRFLQGVDTDHKAVNTIREAVQSGSDGATCLLNYKADGTPFWNNIFIAALRDKDQRIVNYVGVQCEVDKPTLSEEPPSGEKDSGRISPYDNAKEDPQQQQQPLNLTLNSDLPTIENPTDVLRLDDQAALDPFSLENDDLLLTANLEVTDEAEIDWSHLRQVLEADDCDEKWNDGSGQAEWDPPQDECILQQFFESPREFVIRTVRSELIDSLLNSNGDVTTPRFVSALDVLANIYKSTHGEDNCSLSEVLHGSWKSMSRPSYHNAGCLGMNERKEYVYTLGKMAFNMFKPGNLRCTVQDTMNKIEPICKMDKAPSHAPWSLRRELALTETDNSKLGPNTMLKSYDIAIAITIEPGQFNAKEGETIPSPPCRLRGLQIVHGFFLPDPETPNRLTVWFTGGSLSPAPPPEGKLGEEYGGFEQWKELFGGEHKRTWGESLTIMGAKIFLGAEINNEMEPDGSMSYTLHRPYGGHGKGYADVMYVDEEVLITRGNYGTVHVMTKSGTSTQSSLSSSAMPCTAPVTPSPPPPIDEENKKVEAASSSSSQSIDDSNDQQCLGMMPKSSSESMGTIIMPKSSSSSMPKDSDALFDLSSTLSVPSFFQGNHFPDAIDSTERALAAASQFISAARC